MKRSPAAGRAEELRREREIKEDGRYIIFYSFGEAEEVKEVEEVEEVKEVKEVKESEEAADSKPEASRGPIKEDGTL